MADMYEKRSGKATRQKHEKDRRDKVVQVRMSDAELSLLDERRLYESRRNMWDAEKRLKAAEKALAHEDEREEQAMLLPFLWVSGFPARARSPSWFRSGLSPRRTAPAPRRRTPARRCAP